MAEAATAPVPEAPSRTAGGVVYLRDRYVIDSTAALPELDTPSAKAFHCEDRREPGRRLFALICTPGLPPRTDAMALLKGCTIRGVMPLVEYDVAFWPPLGQRVMIVIYDRPLGGRVADLVASGDARITEYDLPKKVIDPLAAGLHGLWGMGIAHRSVRPNNLFFYDAERQDIVLGDCVTVPPGFDQPTVFEPIERGLASPGGRGMGDVLDDTYALGISIVFLMVGQNPVAKLSEDELFTAKMEHGTYATLTGGMRIPLSLLEPLRGMLCDDEEERWRLDQIDLWLDGRKLTPIQRKPPPRADQPFNFAGRAHVSPRTLARAFSLHVPEAAAAIRDSSLDVWLRTHLKDVDKADRIKFIAEQAKSSQAGAFGGDDVLVCRVIMILDPRGPVRYKGFHFMPEAFGPALAVELLRRGDAQVPAEALSRDLTGAWFNLPGNSSTETAGIASALQKVRSFLPINDPGYGVERCLYELTRSMPCQSPIVIEDYVVKIEELLPALDRAASRVDLKTRPIDRHVAAFVAARFEQDIEPHLRALASPRIETSLIGMLSLLAYLQWKLRIENLLGLSSWVGGLLGPAINTYHSRTTRREIEREIPRLVRQGSLPELFDLIDNADKRRTDNDGYATARAEFMAAESEAREIEGNSPERVAMMRRKGHQTAAMSSLLLSIFIVTVTLLLGAF